jgi:hypothetical protein
MRKIKIRGLVMSAFWMFLSWGMLVAAKGLYDAFWGEPEANYYSPHKWEFVSQSQWLTWSGFELAYGLACAGVAVLLWKYAPFLPQYIERKSDK